MAQTYLRIQGVPNYKIFYNCRYYWYLLNAGKLAAKESPLILPSLIWFILRGIAMLLRKMITHKIIPTSTQKDNKAMHIKYLLPNSGYTMNKSANST